MKKKLMKKSLEIKSKNREDAISKALNEFKVTIEDIEVEVLENPIKGFLGIIGSKEGIYKISLLEKEEESITEVDISKKFIEKIIENSKIDAKVVVRQNDNIININIVGKEASKLIGRRGETLDSIQFLTGLALNKINKDSKTRVLVDISDYRKKRKDALIKYAYKMAKEVARTKKTKRLEYMNPYERRIIHSALQNDRYVLTYSEGTDPHRRLVIEYKR